MQTDVLLQKALVEEVKEELKNYTSVNNDGEYIKFNVYPQNLPAKKGKNDDEHFPYVLVCMDEEQINGEDDDLICSIYFLVGINDKNPNKQGHFDIANVLNRLSKRFLEKRLVNGRYRIAFPLTKKFQEEDTYPKFIGGMSTLWTLEKPEIEETEYD
ncbi:hypothetical protein C809_02667 [Lachnospiraceae bacterium MD335]|nr:hypothetical protein C809_02667 [Lachnospiraceae bacterium MD335]